MTASSPWSGNASKPCWAATPAIPWQSQRSTGFLGPFRLEDEDEDEYWLILPQERHPDLRLALAGLGTGRPGTGAGVAWYMASRIANR